MKSTFAAAPIRFRQSVDVYNDASLSENLSAMTPQNIVPFILHLLASLRSFTKEAFSARCKTINLNFIDQPPPIQDEDYNVLNPFVFMYLVTNIPREHSESFDGYQRNKAKGLVRVAESYGLLMDVADCVVPSDALKAARSFFDTHHTLYKHCFALYLGYCNPALEGPATSYAIELRTSVEYAYMLGVRIIEQTIVETKHAVCSDMTVKAYLEKYMFYRRDAMKTYGDNWVFSAILDRKKWSALSRTESFRKLWIIACCVASQFNQTYLNINIKGITVENYVIMEEFKHYLDSYGVISRDIAADSRFHTNRETDQIQQRLDRLNRWAGDDEDDTTAANDSVSAQRSYNL